MANTYTRTARITVIKVRTVTAISEEMARFESGPAIFDVPIVLSNSRLSEWAKCYYKKADCSEWR